MIRDEYKVYMRLLVRKIKSREGEAEEEEFGKPDLTGPLTLYTCHESG